MTKMGKRTGAVGENVDQDAGLEAFFQAGRAAAPAPSDALIATILQDAKALQPEAALLTGSTVRRSFWRDLSAQIGGWPALAGMATATLVGLWIGFSAPDQLETLSGGIVLAGDYTTADTLYAPEDLAPRSFVDDLFAAEEG